MAHKSTRKGRVSIGVSLDPFTTDHSSAHELPKRANRQAESQVEAYTSNTTQTTKERGASGGASGLNSSGEDDGEADVGESDVTDAEEEDNDEDGDVLAPSDRAMGLHGDQAGPANGHDDQKSRLLEQGDGACLEDSAVDSKQSGTSFRNAGSQNEECDSDDELYNKVDLVSDAEEGESDIEKLEEKDIIESREGEDTTMQPDTVPTSATEASDDWAGFDFETDLLPTSISHFEEQYGGNELSILESEVELFNSTSLFADFASLPSLPASPTPTPRRVRFKEPILPSNEDSDIVSDEEDLNGLFNSAAAMLSKDRSNPAEDVDGADDGSSVGSSSGYETDYGDTTDEEDVPASATTRPERLMHQPVFSSVDMYSQASSSVVPSPFKVPTTPATPRRGPRMGSWVADRTKPFAMIDCTGDNMVIVPAKRPARAINTPAQGDFSMLSTANTSPIVGQHNWPMDDSELDFTDFSALNTDPMLASEPDVMPSTLLPTAPSSQNQDQTLASSSVFFPVDEMGDFGSMFPVDDQNVDEDDDEDLLRVEDFIDFGVSSEDEADERDEEPVFADNTTPPTPASTSPTGTDARRQSQPVTSSSQDLLKHLDKGYVGSFRRSQPYHQAHLRRPQSGLSLNSHAFRGGRNTAGHSSLVAQKKRKLSDSFGSRPVLNKRKLSNRR